MKKIILCLIASIAINAFAGIRQAPPAFKVNQGKAVFVDFIKAVYELTYDAKTQTSWANTHIVFMSNQKGFPIFDSVIDPTNISLDGRPQEAILTPVPGNISFVRYVNKEIEAGIHQLSIRTPILNGILYGSKGISNGFFIKDLSDRTFLEKFLPSNLEYDQYQMTIKVKVNGTSSLHNVFANGTVKEIADNQIEISYPPFYTASSLYFHLTPKTKYWRLLFNYTSITGKQIPVTIYSHFRTRNWRMKKKALNVLRELENDYGPWPHPKVLIYGVNIKGGMEYVGATATSLISLGHELQHSYFAKGILPADGNSGWMDEGIASWRDKGHQTHSMPDYSSFNLANHSVYTRKTDKNSYEKGRSFFAYINHQLKEAGTPGLKDFLKNYFEKRKFTTVTTNDLKSDLESYSNLDFTDDFNQYIYGDQSHKGRSPAVEPENPHHVQYTDEEIESIL